MNEELFIIPEKVFSVRVHFSLLFISLLIFPSVIKAQKRDYFIVNGKQIAIGSFNTSVKQMMEDIGIPAVSLAIIDDNKVVYYKAFGYKEAQKKTKVDQKTVFEAASLSKSYLVYVVFRLVDAGLIDLDKPMYQYLRDERIEHDVRYKLITPRMILCHSSGLENWASDNIVDTLEILSDPGTKFIYSGEGYNYLAKVVSRILNKTYEQYTKEMMMRPLKLKNSYVCFKKKKWDLFHKISPWDYAVGHNMLGKELGKWINTEPVPSSANNMTTEDYARLIIGIFDHKHLSDSSINTILKPLSVTRTNDDGSSYYYGCGFEVIYTGHDTIIAHGGNNAGFKNLIFYSPGHKRGFVFFTNSDRGKTIGARLSEMSVQLDIAKCLENNGEEQYPSVANNLLMIYRDKGSAEMFEDLGRLKSQSQLDEQTLNYLARDFMDIDTEITKRLLQEEMGLYPQSAWMYRIRGLLYMNAGKSDSAYTCYLKAKELKFNAGEINDDLQACLAKVNEAKARSARLIRVGENSKDTILAENYNAMQGVWLSQTNDIGGPRCVGADSGRWLEYKVCFTSSGMYKIGFRVASMRNNKVRLLSGDSLLNTINIPSTGGWDKWTTYSTMVQLPAGVQQLRINVQSGGFNFHWMQFSSSSDNAKNNIP